MADIRLWTLGGIVCHWLLGALIKLAIFEWALLAGLIVWRVWFETSVQYNALIIGAAALAITGTVCGAIDRHLGYDNRERWLLIKTIERLSRGRHARSGQHRTLRSVR